MSSADADLLIKYFRRMAAANPTVEHWTRGIAMCERWLEMIRGAPTQGDVDEFLQRLLAEQDAGSGWHDLNLRFSAWAASSGFARTEQ